MSSNYPPGVTGREYAISGPEQEWEIERDCVPCGKPTWHFCQSHPDCGAWAMCDECGASTELPEQEPLVEPEVRYFTRIGFGGVEETDAQGKQTGLDRLATMDKRARLAILALMNVAMHEARDQRFPSWTETGTVSGVEVRCTWKRF